MRRFLIALLVILSVSPARAEAAGTCPKLEPWFKKYGLPVTEFSRIAYRESRCNPRSVSPVRKSTGWPDVGAVQISGSWKTVTYRVCKLKASENHIHALTRLSCNLAVAKYLFDNGGFGHWRGTSK